MEPVLFVVVVLVVSLFILARRRRGDDPEAGRFDLPNDLRDKNTGQRSLPNGGKPWTSPPISGSGGSGVGGTGGAGGGGGGGGGGGF